MIALRERFMFEAGLPCAGSKRFRPRMDRLLPPAETVARLQPLLPQYGVIRVAAFASLDGIGLRLVTVVRPNARSLSVAQGNGLTRETALASGIMEAVETWHAEQLDGPLRFASAHQLQRRLRRVGVTGLLQTTRSPYHDDLRLLLTAGEGLISGGHHLRAPGHRKGTRDTDHRSEISG
jgi:ribosomal protein S12 methylthiotransferase accessory factor YcaO